MATNSAEFKVPKALPARPGTVGVGGDYEIRMAALLGLRCIRNKEVNGMWLATNVDGCGAFDDLVLHIQTKKKKIMYLMQLKHKENSENIGAGEFKKKNDDFSVEKYYKTVAQIKSAIDNKSDTESELIQHLRDNENRTVFIIYTNRGTIEHDFLDKVDKNPTADDWLLYKLINTDTGYVSKFHYDKLGFQYSNNHKKLMDNIFLFTSQIHVDKLHVLIEKELKGFLKHLPLFKQSTGELVQNYIQFMTDWYKGRLGGFYPLTKENIYKVLLSSIVTPYGEIIRNVTDDYCYDLWSKLLNDQWITVVETDDLVPDFIMGYIFKAINDYCDNSKNKKLWKCYPELLAKSMLRITNKSKEVHPAEGYEFLWKTRNIPLVLTVDTLQDLENLLRLLKLFPETFLIIILVKVPLKLDNVENVFSGLQNLNTELVLEILNYPVKLQGRESAKLCEYLTKEELHYISVKDIIHILHNTFSIGTEYSPMTDLFIDRTLEVVWLDPEVLEKNNDEIFVIKCDLGSNLKNLFVLNKLKINYSEVFEWSDDGIEYENSRIIEIEDNFGIEKIERNATLKHKEFHYLTLYHNKYLRWIKSNCSIKNIINFRRSKDLMSKYELNFTNSILNSCLNQITLISAYPGMGKTLLLNYIALNTSTDIWVIKVDLNLYADYYRCDNFINSNSVQHIQHFFDSSLTESQNTDLVKFIFKKYLESKKVILLLDGFDEVLASHQHTVLKMINTLANSNYSLCITTRPNLKLQLEEVLDTFGITINSFTKLNQISFLTQFFSNACAEEHSEAIGVFVEKLLYSSKRSFSDQDEEFTGIPLQTLLLAEVFTEDCRYFIETGNFKCDHFDLVYLYEHFINEKIKIACNKFNNNAEDTFHNHKTFRSLYALLLLFPAEDLTELNIQAVLKLIPLLPHTLDKMQRDGIAVIENKSKVTFVHRSFAEYLAAEWLVNNITGEYENTVRSLIKKIFDPCFNTVRNIFDRILARDCPLHLAIINRQVETAKYLLSSSNSTVLVKTDKGNRTVIHLMASWGIYHPPHINSTHEGILLYQKVIDDPMKQILQLLPDEKIKLAKDSLLDCTQVDYAVLSGCLNIADAVCARLDNLNQCLTLDDISVSSFYLNTFLYRSLGSALFKHAITKECIYALEQRQYNNSNEENKLHNEIMQGNIEEVSLLLCLEKDVNIVDSYGFTPLHIAAMFGNALIMHLLLANNPDGNIKDNSGKTPLHWAVIKGENNIVPMLLDNNVNINAIDNNAMSALHYTVIANISNQKQMVSTLLKNNADITLQDNHRKTVLHYALHYNQIDIFKLLLEFGTNVSVNGEYSNTDYLAEVLSSKDSDGGTILHWAAGKGYDEVVTLLLSYKANAEIHDEDGKTPMHWAAENNHHDVVLRLLSNNADINPKNAAGRTPLHLAIGNNNIAIVKLLLTHGADLFEADDMGSTALLHSVNNMDILELLLSKGVVLNERDVWGRTAIISAATAGNVSAVRLLLSNGANIEDVDNAKMTSLHYASCNGQLETVEILLSLGANIEALDETNRTSLICATTGGFIDIVELLLLNGANVEANDNNGMTALHYASFYNYDSIVDLLITNGSANVETVGSEGVTPLQTATREGYIEIVTSLISKGASLTIQDKRGANALHYAALQGHTSIAELLLDNGAEIDSRCGRGRSALIYSAMYGHLSVITLLLSKKADIEAADNENMTALMWAAFSGHTVIVSLLVGLKASLETKNIEGRTPLLSAVQNGHSKIVHLLVSKGANIAVVDTDGVGPAQWAAYMGFTDILTFFLSKGIQVNIKDQGDNGRTLLMHGAYNNHIEVVNLLLSKEVNINEQDNKGITALHLAARNDHVEVVKLLISEGANCEIQDANGLTPLMSAAFFNRTRAAELLIASGANVNLIDNCNRTILHYFGLYGNTYLIELVLPIASHLVHLQDKMGKSALIHAAMNGHTEAVNLLLPKESDPKAEGIKQSALQYATGAGQLEILKSFQAKGISMNKKTVDGKTLTMLAVLNNQMEVLDFRLDNEENVNTQDDSGMTALHYATESGNLDAINLLLTRGADAEIKNANNETALFCALNYNYGSAFELLAEKGFRIDTTNNSNVSTLHLAAIFGNTSAMETILCYKPDLLDFKDNSGKTALIYASIRGQLEALQLLLSKGASIDMTDNNNSTALHFAVLKGDMALAKALIDNGARVDIRNKSDITALEILRLVILKGTNANTN